MTGCTVSHGCILEHEKASDSRARGDGVLHENMMLVVSESSTTQDLQDCCFSSIVVKVMLARITYTAAVDGAMTNRSNTGCP